MMKRIFVLFLGLLSYAVSASHLAGGDIQYRYIGDSTGVARQYKVILRVYRDVTGIGMPATETVTVSSNCYSNINVPMNLTAGSGIVSPTLFDCVNAGPNVKTLEVYRYIGYVTLPGNCATYRFWYENCCRPPGITNINTSNGNGADGFYFDAELDNTLGQNSSPIFVSEPVRAFCVGNAFNWKQTSVEYDGDSVVYSLINCRENAYPNQVDIPFDAGWSKNQPITSTYFNINPNTGQISFLPTTQEIDVLSVLIEEYRYDSTWNVWTKVGTASRDMMVSISAVCNPTAMSGVQYDTSLYPMDTIMGLPYIEADCGDSTLTLKFHVKLDGYSINDIDFRMTNTNNSQPQAIQKIWSVMDVNYEVDSVVIDMLVPFSQQGDYYLYSKKGNDGNTLINKCGIPMSEFDTILVKVNPCPEPPPPGELPDIPYGGEPLPVPQPDMELIIPNVITPNGDGTNEMFTIQNLMNWEFRELTIFSRWGTIVYRSEDYQNDWNGGGVSDGVYFGVLLVSDDGVVEQHDFMITIIGD